MFWLGLNKMISWWGTAPFSSWEAGTEADVREYLLNLEHLPEMPGPWFSSIWHQTEPCTCKAQFALTWFVTESLGTSTNQILNHIRQPGKGTTPRSSSMGMIALRASGFLWLLSLQWGTTPFKKNHIHISKQKIRNLRSWCRVVHFATQWGSPTGS